MLRTNNAKYLLDTCILVECLRGNRDVVNKVLSVGTKNCVISIITIHELYYGVHRLPEDKRGIELAKVQKLLSRFKVLPLSEAPHTYAKNRVLLEKSGERLDDFDLMIGASAIEGKCILVTDNVKHLGRIPNIRLENWVQRSNT